MNKILNAILKFIKKIIKKIVAFIKKHWLLILALAIVWFAPQISAWLISAGAPTWLTTAVGALGPLSNALHAGVAWIGKVAGKLWSADIHWGWKAAAAVGTSLLIFPEETTELIGGVVEGTAELVGDILSTVVGGVTSGITKGLGLPALLVVGVGAYFLLSNKRKSSSQDALAVTINSDTTPRQEVRYA